MAFSELYGPQNIHEAVQTSLTQRAAAVVVYNAVEDPAAFEGRLMESGELPDAILLEALPQLSHEEASIRQWAQSLGLSYRGISLGSERRGGIEEHTDAPNVSPFAMSVGIRGVAHYLVQSREGNSSTPTDRFDPAKPIDDFIQGPGDVVLVTGAPNSSIHKVKANLDRSARLFIATCRPIRQENPVN